MGGVGDFSVRRTRLDSSRVTASSAVSQAQVQIDTLATLLATQPPSLVKSNAPTRPTSLNPLDTAVLHHLSLSRSL